MSSEHRTQRITSLISGASRASCSLQAGHGAGHRDAARKWEGFGSSAIALALFLIFLLYPSTSSMIFSTFICEDIDDGQSYLRADYAINCASPEHTFATSFASVMLFVYPIGTVGDATQTSAQTPRRQLRALTRA